MSIDRYFYVINSYPRPRWRTSLNACIICILIWGGKIIKFFSNFFIRFSIVSIAFIFPYTSLSSSSNAENSLTDDCSVSAYHPLLASCFFPFCAYYLLPLVIIALCYTRLFFHMRKSSKTITRYRVSFFLIE
jgi:hypothetical protein